MGRKIDPLPAGACDACGRCCRVLCEVGIACYHCHAGVFMSGRWFTFWRDEYGRWLGVPREDLDFAALGAERKRLEFQNGGALEWPMRR